MLANPPVQLSADETESIVEEIKIDSSNYVAAD